MHQLVSKLNTRTLRDAILIRRLIWVYFWLLLFEGALRRWILPGMAGPLLLIRDPVACAILFVALRSRFLGGVGWVFSTVALAGLSFALTLIIGHGNLLVAAFGFRTVVLHFPILFVIPRVFSLLDVIRVGRAVCVVALPMTLLMAAQFFLPQQHFVNIGIGGEGTAGFAGAADRFRPPGTFSFISGLTQFYTLLGAFLAGFGLLGPRARRWWWMVGSVCLVLAIPLSISRTLLFCTLGTGLIFVIAGFGNSRLAAPALVTVALTGLLGLVATMIPAFNEALVAFSARWNMATEFEGGVAAGTFGTRFLGDFFGVFTMISETPVFGHGLGLGTNVGAQLMTGQRDFLLAEGEWLRIVAEMGPLLGLCLIAVRVGVSIEILSRALGSWQRGNAMPLLISGVASLWIIQGNWAQPTSLGFSILAGGLALAATRMPSTVHLKRSQSNPTEGDFQAAPRSPSSAHEID